MIATERLTSMTAHNQWANRPSDERFWDLVEMQKVMDRHETTTTFEPFDFAGLSFESDEGNLLVRLPSRGQTISPTNWAFSQICSTVRAPSKYLQRMDVDRAVANLNADVIAMSAEGIGELEDGEEERPSKAIIRTNGHTQLLGVVSEKYGRIRNSQLVKRLRELPDNWKLVPARPMNVDTETFDPSADPRIWDTRFVENWSAEDLLSRPRVRRATAQDIAGINPNGLGIPVKVGDMIGPPSAFGSDRDLHVLMVDPSIRIENGGLARGFIIKNSEVGAASCTLWAFYFEGICGNLIIHGMRPLFEVSIVHLGNKAEVRMFSELGPKLKKYADSSAQEDEKLLLAASRQLLGETREDTIDAVYGTRILTRKMASLAYDTTDSHREQGLIQFDPNSVRGLMYGATYASQKIPYANQRVELDRASGKLLKLVAGA